MIARWHSGESSHPDRVELAAECALEGKPWKAMEGHMDK